MDIFQLLKAEHAEVKEALKKAEQTSERAAKTRTQLFKTIYTSLLLHAKAEERSLYQRLLEEDKLRSLTLEAVEEHHVAELFLKELQKLPVASEIWTAKMTVLRESVQHHIEEEEKELFPKLKSFFSRDEAHRLAEEFLREKKLANVEV